MAFRSAKRSVVQFAYLTGNSTPVWLARDSCGRRCGQSVKPHPLNTLI